MRTLTVVSPFALNFISTLYHKYFNVKLIPRTIKRKQVKIESCMSNYIFIFYVKLTLQNFLVIFYETYLFPNQSLRIGILKP